MSNASYSPLCTISALPASLQRAFRTEDQADQFIAGRIRFGLLQRYRKMEGYRGDESEGRALIRWNLQAENPALCNVTYGGTSLDLYYALCTSHPAVCKCHMNKFGTSLVRIDDPLELLERICEAWNIDNRASGSAFVIPVIYNKGELVDPPPYLIAPFNLAYAQKSRDPYSLDREYRYIVACKVGTKEDDSLTLDVGCCSDICTLVRT